MGPVYSYMNIIFRENHVNLEQNIKKFKGGLITFASCIFSYDAILTLYMYCNLTHEQNTIEM